MAPRDPQLGAAVHPHLSSWISALSNQCCTFTFRERHLWHSMLSDVQVTVPVPCWGQWQLTGVWLFWAGSLSPTQCHSITWQFSVSAGQNQNILFWRQFWAANKREEKKYISMCVWINPVYFLLTFWCDFGAPSFSLNQNTLQACCGPSGLGGFVWHCCLHCRKPALAALAVC